MDTAAPQPKPSNADCLQAHPQFGCCCTACVVARQEGLRHPDFRDCPVAPVDDRVTTWGERY